MASRFKEFVKKYGKVAIGVHFGVSGVSISGFYIAIKNNVDVESLLEKYQIPGFSNKDKDKDKLLLLLDDDEQQQQQQQQQLVLGSSENKTKQLAKSAGGALALAVLCNKALFPIRVPITMALTPPIARFLRHRNIPKSGA
ncbi:unnamed protein product [Cochlearia groenlandica]